MRDVRRALWIGALVTFVLMAGCGDGYETLSTTSTIPAQSTRAPSATPTAGERSPLAHTATPPPPTPPASVTDPPSPTVAATLTPAPTGVPSTPEPIFTATPEPVRWIEAGKWHYTPSGSTCVYVEATRTQALYRDFTDADVILMDSENCSGTWYLYYPSTGEAFGGVSDPDHPRLRLRLIDGKVTVLPGNDGCLWVETRRLPDPQSPGAVIVQLDTTCDYDHWFQYSAETGELSTWIA